MQTPAIVNTRPRKAVAIVLAIVLIPAAAWAAFMLIAGITGNVKTANVEADWYNSGANVSDSEAATCTADTNTAGEMAVNMTNAFPGGFCEVSGSLQDRQGGNTVPMVVQGINFGGESSAVIATVVSGCGAEVVETSTPVKFRLTIANDAPMNTTIPAGADAGIVLVPQADYVAANCN